MKLFTELYVENLALIESASLSWQNGLNVLTGETGAGKSMVIDAVSLLLGGRASQDYIRSGAEICLVQGSFTGPWEKAVMEILNKTGLQVGDELILTRELQKNGKSTCRINLRAVPLSVFREIGRRLINIHGQMEHMSLLDPLNQLNLLDSYGGSEHLALVNKVSTVYSKWQNAKKALAELENKLNDMAVRYDFLNFQIQEIDNAALRVGEDDELFVERNRLRHAQEIVENTALAWSCLNGGNKAGAPADSLAEAMNALRNLAKYDASVETILGKISDVYYNLEDVTAELRNYKDNITEDPARLEDVEKRLYEIKDICRKYGGSIENALTLAEKNQEELAQWSDQDAFKEKLTAEAVKTEASFREQADILSAARQKIALKLSEAITGELHELQMKNSIFGVDINPASASHLGNDEVVFMFNPNPGEGFKPVAKIASGGEMARIMLAIKVILARLDNIPTLIFDEIDSGLGGIALGSVAQKLAQIAKYSQAVCVSHAPIVAAYADNHLLVSKEVIKGRTITKVQALKGEERINEVARMLAGASVSQTTKAQAQEMINAGIGLKL
jgi:DNA repair protein RecN (Recombination protein N)